MAKVPSYGRVHAYDMDHVSPFYALLYGAQPFNLTYPVTDFAGPHWQDDGEVVRRNGDELVEEAIEAVQIGPDHYRLACRSEGPFSMLRLHWGDEFIATTIGSGKLLVARVAMPRKYAHHRFMASAPFSNDMPAAKLVHELGGGWETVAVGMLTLTVPTARSNEFVRRMAEAGQRLSGILNALALSI